MTARRRGQWSIGLPVGTLVLPVLLVGGRILVLWAFFALMGAFGETRAARSIVQEL